MQLTRTLVCAGAALLLAAAAQAETARGVVYNDANRNSIRDEGESGIAGVRVSNGVEVVKTGSDGAYHLPADDDCIIFVIKPRDWMTPVDENNLPQFYYVHKPAGSPKDLKYPGVEPTGPLPASIDFPLYQRPESERFRVIVFGDTQPRDQKEVDYIAHDVVESLKGEKAAFGVTLGDVVFDDLTVFEPLHRVIGAIGAPWYLIHGNHDTNMDVNHDHLSDETWERLYGPTYYSFDYANAHFIALDDVVWLGEGDRHYHGGLGEEQLEFIKNDLAHVSKDSIVIPLMHIPILDIEEREELFDLLDDFPNTFSLSAHWHQQIHQFIGPEHGWHGAEPHHHLIAATVCGSWWAGHIDEFGIPHATMSDGAPNGHSILTIEDATYGLEFFAARRPASDQMHIHTPEVVSQEALADTEVVVNVYAGSERSEVRMRIGASEVWRELEHTVRKDPYFTELKALEDAMPEEMGRTLPNPSDSSHIWTGTMPAGLEPGVHEITVETTDMFGHTYRETRLIRVE